MVIGLAAMSQAGSSAWAQEATSTPSPKELWDAYPLEPDEAPPTATPSAERSASPTATATSSQRSSAPAPAQPDDGGGVPLAVPIGLAALLAFGAGIGLGVHRRREAASPASSEDLAAQEPENVRRFPRRTYPEPARPAPPPPPVPGARAPSFEDELEDEREAAHASAARQEAH